MSRLQVSDAAFHLNLRIKKKIRNAAEKAASQAKIVPTCMLKKGYFSLFFTKILQ